MNNRELAQPERRVIAPALGLSDRPEPQYPDQNAVLTDSPCLRPEGFKLADYWQQSIVEFKATLPSYWVTVRVALEVSAWLRYGGYFACVEQIGVPEADGWVPVTLRFDIEKAACGYVLGFGAQMEVIDPRSYGIA